MKRLIGLAITLLCACSIALAQEQQQEQQQAQGQELAAVRIVHLALDSGDVDIQFDGEVRIPGLSGNTTSGYVFVTPGQHEIAAVAAGTAPAPAAGEQEQGAQDPAAADQAAQDPAGDPANQPAGDPAAQPAPVEPAPVEPAQPIFTTTVDLEAGSYTTVLVLSTGQDGEQAGQDAAAQEGGDAQAAQQPAELQQASQAVQQANDALGQDDVEGAQQALQNALDQIDAAAQQVEGDMAATIEDARTSLQEAQQALQNDDVEAARNSLQQADDQMQEIQAQAGEQPAEGDQAQAEGADDDAAQATQGERVEVVVIRDRIDTLPGASQAMVRLVNASRNGNLDLVGVLQAESDQQSEEQAQDDQQQEGEDAQQQEGAEQQPESQAQPVQGQDLFTGLSDLEFGAAGEYQEVPAASYHIQVQGQDDVVHLDLPDTMLEPGVVYTFYASSTGDGNVLVTISVDAGVNRAQF